MKTEEVFDMLIGIDENLIASAGEDLENYRYSAGKAYSADEKSGFPWKRVFAAMVCAAVMVGVFFVVKNIGRTNIPIDNSNSEYSSDAGSGTTPPASSDKTSGNTPQTKPVQGYYDRVFKEIVIENISSGPISTYSEVMDMMTGSEYGGLDSFYLVEAIELMKLSDCEKLRGFDDWFYRVNGVKYDEVRDELKEKGVDYPRENLIFRVKVIEDLISGEKCDYEIYTDLSMFSPINQKSGDPPYAPGEKFTVALFNKAEDSDLTESGAGYVFRLDVREIDGIPFAFARSRSDFLVYNFDGTEKVSKTVVTSTTDNPVTYNAKIKLSDLSDFLRRDWLYRGVGSNAANTGYDKNIQSIVEEYKNAGVTLSDEQLQKLSELYANVDPGWERLPYQEGIITGEVDPDAPRLDLETAKKIISEHTDFDEILSEFRKVQRPYYIGGSGHTVILYEMDDLGSEIAIFPIEKQIHYLKVDPDDTEHTETLFE